MTCRRRGVLAALLGAAGLVACTGISTDPQVPVSLQFDSLPALAVVLGDTMRGATLEPTRVPVFAYSGSGAVVTGVELRVIGIDTASVGAFSLLTGEFIAGRKLAETVRVVAQAGALQSQTQTFAVVDAPTVVVRDSAARDSLVSLVSIPIATGSVYSDTGTARVKVLTGTTPVNGLRVRFRVVNFPTALLDSVRIEGSDGKVTTSALMTGGTAGVRVRVFGKARVPGTGTVTIEASIKALGRQVPGSPLSLPIRLFQL